VNMSVVTTGNGHRVAGDPPRLILERGQEDRLIRAEAAVAELLEALGVNTEEEGTRETPRRVAKMYQEMLTPKPFNLTTFENTEHYDELVIARSIPFTSLCQHHMLPFSGHAHVGYAPGERIVGLSKLARIVRYYARSLQVQERLTMQIADFIERELRPKGVGVVLEAEHMCMTIRGVQATGSRTVTSSMLGLLRENPSTRNEFLSLAGMGRN
jgi:GTP cyclohydrolase I